MKLSGSNFYTVSEKDILSYNEEDETVVCVTDTASFSEHAYINNVIAPICQDYGYTSHICTRCGDYCTDNEIPALGHIWTEGVTIADATDDEPGIIECYCTLCGEIRSEEIPVTEHVHKYLEIEIEPTCTEAGITVHICSCGDYYEENEVPALGHSWDAGEITVQPTSDKQGEQVFTCTRCGETRIEVLPALNHTHSYTFEITAPTCTEKGYTT